MEAITLFLTAAAYARFSSSNQREESILAQISAIEKYAKDNNFTVVAKYIDEAKSATTDNRPAFQQMIADAKAGKFNLVIVHKLDRFSRDKFDSVNYRRILKKANVGFHSVLERLDNSPESIIMESLLEGMAEYYSANLSREVRKGLLENAKTARHCGGYPPYGYQVTPEKSWKSIS